MEDEDVQKRGEWPTMIVIIIHNHPNYLCCVRSDWSFFVMRRHKSIMIIMM